MPEVYKAAIMFWAVRLVFMILYGYIVHLHKILSVNSFTKHKKR